MRERIKAGLTLAALLAGITIILAFAMGCQSSQRAPGAGILSSLSGTRSDPTKGATAAALWPLTAVGGLLILTGVIGFLFLRSPRSLIAAGIGVGLCVMNALALELLTQGWFLAVVGATALIALAGGAWQLYQIYKIRAKRYAADAKLRRQMGLPPADQPRNVIEAMAVQETETQ
ncbi:MAG: hypothetical protein KJO36_09865 [Acidimicrobiia bacterium]|nr:hypothetical protein [Acidimicrobiia bacterium]